MPGKSSKKYGPQKGVFEGKTSPGPTGSTHGIKERMVTPKSSGPNQSFLGGPNDEQPVKPGKRGKLY